MTRVLTGTSGFSYKEWVGSFYPEGLKPDQMLAAYSERLKTVEINNTFYRMPARNVLSRWYEETAEDFTFLIKASRRITHFKRLKDAGDELGYLLDVTSELGEKLGGLLFQLPPNFKADTERLSTFLELLPSGCPAAFEFRHDSWSADEVHDLLRERDVALCISDTDEAPDPEVVVTAEWGYLRLRRMGYSDEDLTSWNARIQGTGWNRCFTFFKHEDSASGPDAAARMAALAAA